MNHLDTTQSSCPDRLDRGIMPHNKSHSILFSVCLLSVCAFSSCINVQESLAQNVQATWDGGNSGFWTTTVNQLDPAPSDWTFSGNILPYHYPSTALTPGGFTFFDVIIDGDSEVTILPLLPISISNLTMSAGSSVELLEGTDFLLVNAGTSPENGVVDGGQIGLSNSTGTFLTELFLDGSIRFTGGGQILMSDSTSNVIRGNTAFNVNSRLILDDYTIEGAGSVGFNELLITINSGSMIRATGSNLLTINPSDGANAVFNNGTLQADGGTLRLFDGGFDNSFGVIEALDGGVVEIGNARVTKGTFESSGSGVIRAIGGASLVGPITNNARFEIPNSTVILTGSVTNSNQVAIGSAVAGGTLLYDIDTMLDGGGEVIMSDNVSNQLNAVFNTTGRLTNVDNIISGAGLLGGRITNRGTIRADQTNPLIFQTADIANGGINQGLMEATNGATFRIHISTIENDGGLVQATDGGTVLLTGSATIQGGNVNIVGPSSLVLSDGTVDATVTNSGQGTIATVFGINNFLSGTVTNPLGGTILVNDDTRLKLDQDSAYNNAGTIRLDGFGSLPGFAGTRLMLEGTVTLQGGGEVAMSNSVSNTIEAVTGNPTVDTLINQDNRIHGSGSIGRNVLTIINRSTIEANLPFVDNDAFGTIVIDPGAGDLTNEGVIRATNGGRLQLFNGVYNNAAGLIEANAGSTIDLEQAVTITGGTIRTNGTGIVNVNSEVTFDGIGMTIDADTVINSPQGRLNLIGDISNRKTITVAQSSIRFSGTVSLTGSGNIILTDSPNSSLNNFPDAIPDQLINVDNTISGAGNISFLSIVNQGTMRADGTNALIYQVPAAGFDNQGRLEVSGSGGMQIIGGPFTNSGLVDISAGSTLLRDGDYIQTAGQTNVDGTLAVTFLRTIDIQGGMLTGSGNIEGSTLVNGTLAPGNSAGILNFDDTLSLLFGLQAELGGTLVDGAAPNSFFVNSGLDSSLIEFDQVNVFDSLTLADGLTIDVNFIDGYRPSIGDFFDILTGDSIVQIGALDFQFQASSAEFDYQLLRLFDPVAGFDRDVVRLSVTSIPEPSQFLLLMLIGFVFITWNLRLS